MESKILKLKQQIVDRDIAIERLHKQKIELQIQIEQLDEGETPNISTDLYEIIPSKQGTSIKFYDGMQLPQSLCKPYKELEYVGKGFIKAGKQRMALNAPHIILLEQDLQEGKVPNNYQKRIEYSISRFGRNINSLDRVIFNLKTGNRSLQEVLGEYNAEQHLQFNKQGTLVI